MSATVLSFRAAERERLARIFPDPPALPSNPALDAMVAKQRAARALRRQRLDAARREFERQGYSTWDAHRAALLQMCAKSRKMAALANTVLATAYADLSACQNDLVDLRRDYYRDANDMPGDPEGNAADQRRDFWRGW
jgi:hypothetical protein